MMGEKLLSVRDLSISAKDETYLVEKSAFDIGKERCVGIIGESGSGKSLTCKAVLGLLPSKTFRVSGEVEFKGKDLLALDDASLNRIRGKDIAFVMQNPMTAFNPVFKVGNQIVETLRTHMHMTKSEAHEIAVDHLQKMNLPRAEELMNSYPHTLSGGMLQRVMIAIALMMTPELIIADEATTALDISTQAMILDEFKKIKDSGLAMLVVSHDFGVVAELADDIIVMKDGRIIEQGMPHDILFNPGEAYTKELIEASALRKMR